MVATFDVEAIRRGDAYCPSTHGASGWPPGAAREGDKMRCPICLQLFDIPRPTVTRMVLRDGWRGTILRQKRLVAERW